jgi:tRNA pseudouridine38-40 synthase
MVRSDRDYFLMRFGYDGGRFHGVPPQPGLPTVGGALRARFEDAFGQPPRNLVYTSRTDGGVHALGNLATAWIPEIKDVTGPLAALCQHRDDGLSPVEAVLSPAPIHARALSIGKHYRYCIETGFSPEELDQIEARVSWRGRMPERRGLAGPPPDSVEACIWQIHPDIDVDRMRRAAGHMLGTLDFNALRTTKCRATNSVRTIDEIAISVRPSEGRVHYTFDIRGPSFLRKMIRVIIGTLTEVGVGLRDPDSIPALIEEGDRRKAGITAPSRGLTLMKIFTEEDWFA